MSFQYFHLIPHLKFYSNPQVINYMSLCITCINSLHLSVRITSVDFVVHAWTAWRGSAYKKCGAWETELINISLKNFTSNSISNVQHQNYLISIDIHSDIGNLIFQLCNQLFSIFTIYGNPFRNPSRMSMISYLRYRINHWELIP